MSLTIGRFVTQCQVPRRLKVRGELLSRVAQELFPRECARQLSSRWPLHDGVYCIRRLVVRLTVSRQDLNETRLSELWASAFVNAMTDTLARPSDHGPEAVWRAESRSAWLAKVIASFLAGDAAQRWEYQEFKRFFDSSTVEAILGILGEEPSQIVPTLLILQRSRRLDRFLSIWDETTLERLCAAIVQGAGLVETKTSIHGLENVAQRILAQGFTGGGAGLGTRQRALRLFLAQAGEPGPVPEGLGSPQSILSALKLLEALLELPLSEDPSHWATDLAAALSPGRPGPEMLGLLQEIRQRADEIQGQSGSGYLMSLARLLADLKPLVSPEDASGKSGEIRWVSSDFAGLMLLVGLLNGLRWPESFLRSSLGARYGPRAVTYLLAGLGLALLGNFVESPERLDPGLALFAGWLGDADLAGWRSFLTSAPVSARKELLLDLNPGEKFDDKHSQSWAKTFDYLAELAVREFALRLRGFRQSSRTFVTKHFLAVPGRIRIEDTKLLVFLPANPFQVVLHLAGMDEKVEGVSWLGRRQIEFSWEGS